MLDIIGRREKGRNQPHRANFQERCADFAAGGHANVHFDAPARSQDGDGSRDIIRDVQAEGSVILRADGDDPQGGVCTGQGSGHGRNGAVTAAYHEHTDPLREGILDHPGQVAARFDQVGFRNELPGLHLMDHIHYLYGRWPGCPGTGVEDQLGSHAAFICRAQVFVYYFIHLVISFVAKIHLAFFSNFAKSDRKLVYCFRPSNSIFWCLSR